MRARIVPRVCVLLLAACASPSLAQYDMTDFQQVSPQTDTGFYASTLQHIWAKYNAFGGSAPGAPMWSRWQAQLCSCDPRFMGADRHD